MVSFQRMKDEIDGISSQITARVPIVGRSGCLTIFGIGVLILCIIAFAIGFGSGSSRTNSKSLFESSPLTSQQPNYLFVSNNSGSCPPLVGERLLTTMDHGHSFEGLVVNLACRGDFNVFPNQVKCRRKNPEDQNSELEWSHLPVCYPSVLVSKTHWIKTLHARSVSCSGDNRETKCYLSCIRDYVAVESDPYVCKKAPCDAWSLGDAQCYMCDQSCPKMHSVDNPRSEALLSQLGCNGNCDKIIVKSNGPAAVWQNKRTGLFKFLGEHNGRPVYQNNATKEFLFYTSVGSEWLVGPDFRKPHAGIQVFGNDDTSCPDRSGGKNVSRLYIDSSEPSIGGTGKWTPDDSLSFECMTDTYKPVECTCNTYKVFHIVYQEGAVPDKVSYLMGIFEKIDAMEVGLLAPLYYEQVKNLYLFSHHPQGKVWQVSSQLSTTPMRVVFDSETACPDASDSATWEWFNTTTTEGQQIYIKDDHIKVKCIDNFS